MGGIIGMTGFARRVVNKFIGDHLEFRIRLFNTLGVALIVICAFSSVSNYYISDSTGFAAAIILASASVFGVFLLWYAMTSGRYLFCRIVAVAIGFFGVAPAVFFTSGGYKGGMPIFLVTFTMFTVFFLDGGLRKAFVILQIIFYASICVYAYYFPESVRHFANEESLLVDVLIDIVLASVILGATIALHLSLYDKQTRELEAARKTAVEYEKMKSEFFADMSHELRTPLTVIAASAQMAETQIRSGNMTEQLLSDLKSINMEAMRLAGMTDCALKTLTTPFESGGIENLMDRYIFAPIHVGDFVGVVSGIVKPAVMQKGKSLAIDIEEDVPPVYGDADTLLRLLLNLLHNAVNHSGGQNITVRAHKAGDSAVLTVEDDGCGIPPELLPKIFDRGVSGTGSTGLGLYVCRNIALAHGGDIKIENTDGGGTRVAVTLPTVKG